MEIKISSRTTHTILLVISWIIFIGVCIEAGGFIFNTFHSLVLNHVGAKYFWQQMDLSSLYEYDKGFFFAQTLLVNIVAILRVIIFWVIVKFLQSKKLSWSQPFTRETRSFIIKLSYLSLATGFFSVWGVRYSEWLISKGIEMPGIQYLRLAGADVWLFMGVILIVIAYIFKRGIEIQTENELTI